MPNYSFVVDATYDPLSYEEIAAPVREAAAYHQSLQDKYDELKLTTQYMDSMIPRDDPEYAIARANLDEYLAALNTGADTLMKNGAWGQRDTLSGVRDVFGKKMVPVQMAWAKREQEDKEQRERLAKNPLLEFSRRASATGLDSYINNPLSGYETVDPANATAMVATMSQMLSKELIELSTREAIELRQSDPELYNYIIEHKGLPHEHVMDWRNVPVLRAIMKRALNTVGMDMDDKGMGIDSGVWSKDAVNRVINAAYTGFSAAVGGDTLHIKEDPYVAAQSRAAGKVDGAEGLAPTAYILTNDNSVTLDDVMTDGGYMEKLENAAAVLGYKFDKANAKFEVGTDPSLAGFAGDYIPGILAEMTPGKESASTIMRQVADENGWEKGAAGYKDKKTGKYVTRQQQADALTAHARQYLGRYHTLQDISLASGYNEAFKGVNVYPMKGKLGKGGVYDSETDHPVPISSILDDTTTGSKQLALDSTPTNGGLVLTVTKGGKPKRYFIKVDGINSPSIRAAVQQAVAASAERNRVRKSRGLTDAEFNQIVTDTVGSGYMNPQFSDIMEAQGNYVTRIRALQNAIGMGNTVGNININS